MKLTEAKAFGPKDKMKYTTPSFPHRDLRAAGSLIYHVLYNFGTQSRDLRMVPGPLL